MSTAIAISPRGTLTLPIDYCVAEVEKNVRNHPAGPGRWRQLIQPRLELVGSIYVLDCGIDTPIVPDAARFRIRPL